MNSNWVSTNPINLPKELPEEHIRSPQPSRSFFIIKDNKNSTLKRSVDVRLQQRITHDQLTKLAYEIRNLDHTLYKRTFILYYLPHMIPGEGAWASTHFNPNLKVKIIGASIEDAKKLSQPIQTTGEKEIVGNYFQDLGSLSRRITIYREKKLIFIKTMYGDDSQNIEEIYESKDRRGIRLKEKETNDFGEYYIVNTIGDLEFWDKQGLIETLKKLDI